MAPPFSDVFRAAQDARIRTRALSHFLAFLGGILTTAATAWGAKSVMGAFADIAASGRGGVGTIAAALCEANTPLVVSSAVGAFLTIGFLVVVVATPNQDGNSPGLLLSSLAPVASCAPALLLWRAESIVLDVLGHRTATGLAEASSRLALFLTASFLLALLFSCLLGVASVVSPLICRLPASPSRGLATTVWVGNALLLVAVALGFYARSSYLHAVAIRGEL
jgi:hypothetical protein